MDNGVSGLKWVDMGSTGAVHYRGGELTLSEVPLRLCNGGLLEGAGYIKVEFTGVVGSSKMDENHLGPLLSFCPLVKE